MIPDEIVSTADPVVVNISQPRTAVAITNTEPLPVHLEAHYHVVQANRHLLFECRHAWDMRLVVPAASVIRPEPETSVDVPLVPIVGARIVRGFNAAVDGLVDTADLRLAQ